MPQSQPIYCPKCNHKTKVYHLEWTELKCTKCESFIKKNQWKFLQLSIFKLTNTQQSLDFLTDTLLLEARHEKLL